VQGCRAQRPHAEALIRELNDPAQLTLLVKSSIAELINSAKDDIKNGRFFGYITRWRQPEELYYRTLYVLFVAEQIEIPHILSGERPNSFVEIWRTVNKAVLEGRGVHETQLEDLNGDIFTPMDTINSGAHASFTAILTCLGYVRNPEYQEQIPRHFDHWKRFCTYLDHMERMFKAGRAKEDVLAAVRHLHKPASAWQQKPLTDKS